MLSRNQIENIYKFATWVEDAYGNNSINPEDKQIGINELAQTIIDKTKYPLAVKYALVGYMEQYLLEKYGILIDNNRIRQTTVNSDEYFLENKYYQLLTQIKDLEKDF